MELWNLIEQAELSLLGGSGLGLGAILLSIVALAVVWKSKAGFGLASIFSAIGKALHSKQHK